MLRIKDILAIKNTEERSDQLEEPQPKVKSVYHDRIQALLYPEEELAVKSTGQKPKVAQPEAYKKCCDFWRSYYDLMEDRAA